MGSKDHIKLGILKYSPTASISPLMHELFMKKLGINVCYETFSISPSDLEQFISGEEISSLDGFNVTIPHKRSIIEYMHRLTLEAEAVGAVNTVAVREGKIIGHNTDTIGFKKAVEMLDLGLKRKDILLFGAGGAARAVVYILGFLGVSSIHVRNRTAVNAERLSDLLKNSGSKTELIVLKESEGNPSSAETVINALAGGIFDANWLDDLPELRFFYDINYTQNAFDKTLLKEGTGYSDGLSMLVYQGFESLKFWLDKEIPDDGITDSVLTELNGEI